MGPLGCVLSVVEERFGVPVVVAALPDEVAGACHGDGDARVIFVNGRHAIPRQRFTLAHELGHLRCAHDGAAEQQTFVTLAGTVTTPFEVQANAFAGEFLLPRAAVKARFLTREPGLEELVVVAAEYGVSAIAALFAAQAAGVLGEDRATRVRGEIDAGLHREVHDRLGLPLKGDRLEAIEDLPYVSPALERSALGALAGGATTTGAAARAAGVAPRELGLAFETISRS